MFGYLLTIVVKLSKLLLYDSELVMLVTDEFVTDKGFDTNDPVKTKASGILVPSAICPSSSSIDSIIEFSNFGKLSQPIQNFEIIQV